MKNTFFLLIVSVIGIMASCKNSDNKQTSIENLKSKAIETLGDDVSCTNNDNGAYSLCQVSKTMQGAPGVEISFIVYSNSTGEVVHKDAVSNGTVIWATGNKLEIFRVPGIMAEGQTRDDYTFIYDLDTKETTKKK